MGGRWLLWGRLPPAEGVEHPEEGDRHVDEDDQGEQGVGDAGVGTNSKSGLHILGWDDKCASLTCIQGPLLVCLECPEHVSIFYKRKSQIKKLPFHLYLIHTRLSITEQILTA